MTIFLINGRPHTSSSNGFQVIDEQAYYQMIEQGEIETVQEVEIID